jgi:hypothetical protein
VPQPVHQGYNPFCPFEVGNAKRGPLCALPTSNYGVKQQLVLRRGYEMHILKPDAFLQSCVGLIVSLFSFSFSFPTDSVGKTEGKRFLLCSNFDSHCHVCASGYLLRDLPTVD